MVLVLVGCSGNPTTQDGGADSSADANSSDASSDASGDSPSLACNPLAPFGAPTQIPFDRHARLPRLSSDEKTIFVGGWSMISGVDTIYFATRTDTASPFSTSIQALVDPLQDQSPSITSDGLWLFFRSFRSNVDEPMLAFRTAVDKPLSATSAIQFTNLSSMETRDAFIRADGKVLYATYTLGAPSDHIRRGARTGPLTIGMMSIVQELDSPNAESAPTVTPDDLTIYFGRAGGSSEYHIWMARRAKETDPCGTPQLVSELDMAPPASQEPGWISADGCTLYFHRDPKDNGLADLFVARRGM
jgi:hypothetical protein